VATLDRATTTAAEVTRLMVGREIAGSGNWPPRAPGESVLAVRGLSLDWPGHARRWRLRDINFDVRRGEIVGVAGLMGAGRTELLECLFGAARDTVSGEVLLEGRRVAFGHPSEALAAGLALVSEDRKRLGLFGHFSTMANISVCTLRQAVVGFLISSARERTTAAAMVQQLDVKTASLDAPVLSLSGGNQQKAVIGRWLLTHPKVLLLDDPTRGVDVGAKADLYNLMDSLCREGMAILVTSSELPELLTVCDRILVLCEGRLTAEFSKNEATEEKIMAAATGQGVN
jgi:ABC-type sugar transport system ATPase subunit